MLSIVPKDMGWVEVICGPMFSGKSEELIRRLRRAEIAKLNGAQAVIAPIDNQAWLPFGLARQLREWLERINVACVTPMPFCAFTEDYVNVLRLKENYGGAHPGFEEREDEGRRRARFTSRQH